ncbi:MAG: hypothetical protein JOZ74_17680 [Bradyrhizobium sp.]|nr:hypothetical protein [Bradyrhizobium sp.]
MFRDGTYSAWFRTATGEGTGIVHCFDGKIRGRDSILSYDGTYETAGDHFSAIVRTRRHTAGHATLFGIDDVELKLEGTVLGNTAQCTGTVDVAPGLTLEVTLIPCEGQPSIAAPPAAPRLDRNKLPKLPKLSRGR